MEIKTLIIHCSATKEGKNFTAKDIDRWHKERGWNGIGYHYVVTIDGDIQPGRPETVIGAHCAAGGQNRCSLGICYIGGLDKSGRAKDTRTPAQRVALRSLLQRLKTKYPKAVVRGHCDFEKGKACPCFNAKDEYAIL